MVKAASVQERRIWVRAKRVLSLQFRLVRRQNKEYKDQWHLSTTQDMSLGGLAFYTDIEYRHGDILELHVVMSGILDIFNGQARVVRLEKRKSAAYYLVAVEYMDYKQKSRKAKTYVHGKRIKSEI